LVVTLTCLFVAASLLVSVSGATRNLSQAQVCANNLRQLFTGLTAYVNQYSFYPPHNPYPQYMSTKTFGSISTNGFDPNIGFIMTHGLGLTPPATDTQGSGHFIWFGADFDDLPDVCKCPSLPPSLMQWGNPEIDANAIESFAAQYALSYQTSGTCRAPTPLIRLQDGANRGIGGRNPAIPDPTMGLQSAQPYDNAQGGPPYVWVTQHRGDPEDNSSGSEYACYIQAVEPSEVQLPSRVYYLADSRDYRPVPGGWPRAGQNSGWGASYGNILFLGTRHFGYVNVLYLDGRVSRDNLMHYAMWNLSYAPPGDAGNVRYRSSSFATNIPLANIGTQGHLMPALMVRGWEYFFEANGVAAR
jgi:prepilin-type processing-associated H-X9-DG protein